MLTILTTANLRGLEAEARDKDGHSPNECFLKCRSAHCAAARDSIDLERKSWVRLMRCARRRDENSPCITNEAEETGQGFEDIGDEYRQNDSFSSSSSETSSGSISEEEFVDVYECNEKED